MSTCNDCDGSGNQHGEFCEKCENNGWVEDPSDGGTMTCPDCDGDAGEQCETCSGSGEDPDEEDED